MQFQILQFYQCATMHCEIVWCRCDFSLQIIWSTSHNEQWKFQLFSPIYLCRWSNTMFEPFMIGILNCWALERNWFILNVISINAQCTFNPNLLIYADNFLLTIFCCLDFEKRQKNRKWVRITPDSVNFESLNNWTEKTIAHKKNANECFNLYLSCMHLWFIRNCKPTQWIFGLDSCSCFN